jgi:hypothetical protein
VRPDAINRMGQANVFIGGPRRNTERTLASMGVYSGSARSRRRRYAEEMCRRVIEPRPRALQLISPLRQVISQVRRDRGGVALIEPMLRDELREVCAINTTRDVMSRWNR